MATSAGTSSLQNTVRWYQTILKIAAGYPDVPVNGNHNDSRTKAAMRDFHAKYGLKGSSYLTVASNMGLNQIALQRIYLCIIDTGVGKSVSALKPKILEFQSDYGLLPDGDVGPLTMGKMMEVLDGPLPPPYETFAPAAKPRPFLQTGTGDPDEVLDFDGKLGVAPSPGVEAAVIGTDDRESQTDTVREPNRWISLFNVGQRRTEVFWTWAGGQLVAIEEKRPSRPVEPFAWSLGGTGCLIGPRHVLTAAHVISQFGPEIVDGFPRYRLDGEAARVSPGYNGAFPLGASRKLVQPYGTIESEAFTFGSNYELRVRGVVVNHKDDGDFALVRLPAEIDDLTPVYKRRFILHGKLMVKSVTLPRLGFWGDSEGYEIRATTARQLQGREVFTIGYPIDKPNVGTKPKRKWMQWKAAGRVDSSLGSRGAFEFHFAGDVTSGQSGSPIWIEDKRGERTTKVMVGVAVRSRMTGRKSSVGLVLTEAVLQELQSADPTAFQYRNGKLSPKR